MRGQAKQDGGSMSQSQRSILTPTKFRPQSNVATRPVAEETEQSRINSNIHQVPEMAYLLL